MSCSKSNLLFNCFFVEWGFHFQMFETFTAAHMNTLTASLHLSPTALWHLLWVKRQMTGTPLEGFLRATCRGALTPVSPWGAADPLSNSFPHYIKLHSGVITQPCLTFDQKRSPDVRVSPHKNTPAVQLDSQRTVKILRLCFLPLHLCV